MCKKIKFNNYRNCQILKGQIHNTDRFKNLLTYTQYLFIKNAFIKNTIESRKFKEQD